ncbi:hypothetical protein ACFQH6_17475 [Halobacteriaceae archaeon GCM10025711]
MNWRPDIGRVTLVKLALGLIAVAAVVTILQYRFGGVEHNLASLIVNSLAALGTVVLALATFETIQQNQRSLEELEKDREKPLKIDELGEIIQPAIDGLDTNIEHLEAGFIAWEQSRDSPSIDMATPLPDDGDRAVLRRFKRDYPELYERMDSYSDAVQDVKRTADSFASAVEPELRSALEDIAMDAETDHARASMPDSNITVTLLVNDVPPDGLSTNSYQSDITSFWDQYDPFWRDLRDDLVNLAGGVADHELSALNSEKDDILAESRALREKLIEVKGDIRAEYGISKSEFSGEEMPSIVSE